MKPLRIGLPSGSLQEATLELFRRAGFNIAANFYIANSAVLVPMFNSPTDQPTLDLLRPFFPDRKVVGIDCPALVGATRFLNPKFHFLLS